MKTWISVSAFALEGQKQSLIFDKVILRCLLDKKSMMMTSQPACKKFRAEFSNADMQIQIC